MELKNYWWLLIWLFLFGAASFVFIPQREEIVLGKPRMRWGKLSAAALALPYVFWAAWRSNRFGDTGQYRATFKGMPVGLSQFPSYLTTRSKGPGFVTIEYLFKTLLSHSDIAFFFFIALIEMYLLVRIYRKYSNNFWMSMFLFVASTDYLSWMHNGIRQFLAVTIIFTAIPLIVHKRFLSMCLVVLLAATIHSSVLIFLPFVFVVNGKAWNTRTLLFIFGLVLAIVFVDNISDFIVKSMEDTVYRRDISIFLNDDGTNILRVLFYSIPTFLTFLFRGRIAAANNPMINICANLSIISSGVYLFSFFTSGILIGALPIYFSLGNYILIPWLLEELFTPGSLLLTQGMFVGVYSFFFYYQVGQTWHLL